MKALLVAPAWVGDMVMAHALVQALAERYSALELTVVAPPVTAPLASRMAEVAHVEVLDVGHGELGLGARWRLAQRLKNRGIEQAYVLPNSFKSALLPWFARVPTRTGWLGEQRYGLLNDHRKLDPDAIPRMVDRFVRLGWPAESTAPLEASAPVLGSDPDNAAQLVERFGLHTPSVALCPGAEYGSAKQWPAAHWADLALRIAREGRQVWLVGGPGDRNICAAIMDRCRADGDPRHMPIDLAGQTELLDAVDLLSTADEVVSNDSGLMHVACAVGRPVVAIYGSTSAEFTPPLGNQVAIVRRDIECAPCFERVCPLGHLRCLTEIAPPDVAVRMKS